MNSIYRRLGGLAIALLLVPVFIGLLACMPVPVGDQERSRADPDFAGAWLTATDDVVYLFLVEQWDKRTWYIQLFGEWDMPDTEDADAEILDSYEAMLAIATGSESNDMSGEDIFPFKAWSARLGKHRFMTWQPWGFGISLEENNDDMYWYVFRMVKRSRDHFELHEIDGDSDLFDDLEDIENFKKMQRAYEKVIKRHAENPELYLELDDLEIGRHHFRVQEEDLDLIPDF
jgi:hypothetical protein